MALHPADDSAGANSTLISSRHAAVIDISALCITIPFVFSFNGFFMPIIAPGERSPQRRGFFCVSTEYK
jgi:hypothetical protein